MLVPAQIVSRPGENGSPPGGACKFTGASHADHGPYASTIAGYYSRPAIADLARQFGFLLVDEAQGVYDKLIADVAILRETTAKMTSELSDAEAERAELLAALDAAGRRAAELTDELAKTRTAAQIADEYLVVAQKPKAPKTKPVAA